MWVLWVSVGQDTHTHMHMHTHIQRERETHTHAHTHTVLTHIGRSGRLSESRGDCHKFGETVRK